MSRPSRGSIICLQRDAIQRMWEELGPFSIDLMVSTAYVPCISWGTRTLPISLKHDCHGSSGINVLAQDDSKVYR